MYKLLKNRAGMTLIEIMVVIAIIGLVLGSAAVYVLGQFEQAKVDTAINNIKTIESAMEHYKRDAGFYPSTEQGLLALVEKPSFGRIPKRYARGGYLKKLPKDPWKCDYVYYSPGIQGHAYEIYSLGADCAEGGEEENADIASFETD